MARRSQGRPTSCTQEMIEKLSLSVRAGLSIERACSLAGCSDSSYKTWKIKGENQEEPYAAFLAAIKEAEAGFIEDQLKVIRDATKDLVTTNAKGQEVVLRGQWAAAAWLLERKYRAEYGKYATKMNLQGSDEGSEIDQVVMLSKQIVDRMVKGEITAEEAKTAIEVVEMRRKAIETGDLAKQLAELSVKLK